MGQVSPQCATGHPAPSWLPGWTAGCGSPRALAISCKNQYEEDWEHGELGRLQIPALLLGEEVRDGGCGPSRPQAAVGTVKTERGDVGMPASWPASRSPAQGVFRPCPALPHAREGILQTSWQPQERRSSGLAMVIKTPRSEYSRLSPSPHLRAGAAGALGARRGQACPVGTPRPIAPLSPNQPADGVTVGAPPRRLGLWVPVRRGWHRRVDGDVTRGELRPPKNGCAMFRALFVLPAPARILPFLRAGGSGFGVAPQSSV